MDAQETIDQKLRDAIRCRLLFRHEFLSALDEDLEVLDTRSTDNFVSCLSTLSGITETVALGTPVPEAFSLKIQRKLASTVPPRPIVQISPEDALAHLKRLCQDAIDMQEMLDYRGPSNFKVLQPSFPLFFPYFFSSFIFAIVDPCLDRNLESALPETPTVCLHSLSPSSPDCERHDHPGRGPSQEISV